MHLSARHGRTVDDIVDDGFEIDRTLDWLGERADPPRRRPGRAAPSS